jgi:nitroimidazol reductase NimA-like FMN-containing flavoprotein (pyridoxamine 5'-phosphate oxidase superfamily)
MEDDMSTGTTPRPTDRQGLEVLDPSTCLHLLDLSPVGRVAFVQAGDPVVLPVNHVRIGRRIFFRTASGITLDAAVARATMAFEVDGYDEETRTGWSVLARGEGDLEEDEEVLAELAARDLHPWADEVERPTWVRVLAMEISGRRIPDTRHVS